MYFLLSHEQSLDISARKAHTYIMSNNTETYERVTANILSLIEKGDLLPWQKPWKSSALWARSMSTNKEYNGVNRWVLTLTADANGWSPWFGTYKQIEALGGQVRKGEKSTLAILWKPMKRTNKDTGVEESFFMLRAFSVFSASQADNLPEKFYAKPDVNEFVSEASAEEVLSGYFSREAIPVTYGGNSACYSPRQDSIRLPQPGTFTSSDHYYATAFHEAAHSTGAEKRLNRPGVVEFDHFGSHQYSREELVAELGSSLLLGVLGLDKPNLVENQAAYLKHWMTALAEDPQAFVWAAGRAEKAANLILGVLPQEATEVSA